MAWTSAGPCPPDRVDELRWHRAGRRARHLAVYGVDKFPRMTDYVVPPGVRIADADRVRLGAHLAAGTTVMHEGFVNFNAGTLGTSMVEGRIVAGVVVGDGSDIGGGASIMGTLSGGGKDRSSGSASAACSARTPAVGISLGDDCVVEAGCYITAGSKVTLPDGRVVKARELSGVDRPAVLAQLGDRGAGGPPAHGHRHRAQRRPARQRLSGLRNCAGRHEPLDRLPGDGGDRVKVVVIVDDHRAVHLGTCGNDEIGDARSAVLPTGNQLALHRTRTLTDRARNGQLQVELIAVGLDGVELGEIPGAVAHLQVDDLAPG